MSETTTETRYDLMRRHKDYAKEPSKYKNDGWVMHASFRKRENAERLMREMQINKSFQEYKIIDSDFPDAEPFWSDENVERYL